MSTDITLDKFETESIYGKKIIAEAEHAIYTHFEGDVSLEVGDAQVLLAPENARALGWALIKAAASLEWTT